MVVNGDEVRDELQHALALLNLGLPAPHVGHVGRLSAPRPTAAQRAHLRRAPAAHFCASAFWCTATTAAAVAMGARGKPPPEGGAGSTVARWITSVGRRTTCKKATSTIARECGVSSHATSTCAHQACGEEHPLASTLAAAWPAAAAPAASLPPGVSRRLMRPPFAPRADVSPMGCNCVPCMVMLVPSRCAAVPASKLTQERSPFAPLATMTRCRRPGITS